MLRLSNTLARSSNELNIDGLCLVHYCNGCQSLHQISVSKPNHLNAIWSWNGNAEKPSFSPSINIVGVCHYHLVEGKISYCADSIHALAGKTVDLPDLPDWLGIDTNDWQENDSA